MEEGEETIEASLRREAISRMTSYSHPEIELKHEPISGTECEELKEQLRDHMK